MPVGGYCYGRDVGEGFCENKLKEVEVSAVAGAGPTPHLKPRQDGGWWWWWCWRELTLASLDLGRPTWPGQAMLLGQTAFSGWRAREGNGEQTRKRRVGGGGVCNEVALPVNSWSQGHKVSDAVCT